MLQSGVRRASRSMRLGVLVVLGIAGFLGIAGTALADGNTGFDSPALSLGTTVSSQFAGVNFVTGTFAGVSGASALPTIESPVAYNGTHSLNISTSGGTEFPQGEAIGVFASARQSVSVRAYNITDPGAGTFSGHLTLSAYTLAGQFITSDTTTVSNTDISWTLLSVDGGAQAIGFVKLSVPVQEAGQLLLVDALTWTDPATPPPADFQISSTTTGTITEPVGGTVDVPIDISRSNFSGPVTFSASGLPSGVTASFSPNPASGGTTTMTLSSPELTFPSSSVATISADGTPGTRAISRTVTSATAIELTADDTASHDLPPCSSVAIPYTLTRAPGVNGPVSLSAYSPGAGGGLEPGISVGFDPASLSPGSAQRTVATYTRDASAHSGFANVRLTAASGSLPASRPYAPISYTGPLVDAVVSGVTRAPQLLQPGSLVTIEGRGFCPGTTVAFSGASAVAPLDGATTTRMQVRIPRLAAPGPITVTTPAGQTGASAPVDVGTFRSTSGFAFPNNAYEGPGFLGVPGGDFFQWEETFGDQMFISVDLCEPLRFHCPVPTGIPNPLLLAFLPAANRLLTSGNGSCFGFALASRRIASGQRSLSTFAPAGARTVWGLADTPALNHYIDVQHQAQASSEMMALAWQQMTAGAIGARTPASTRADIEAHLAAGDPPIVSLVRNGAGHAVVAYDTETRAGDPPGSYRIRVWDNNVPFTTAEAGNPAAHATADDGSTILVRSNGDWEFDNLRNTDGTPWTGTNAGLFDYSVRQIPETPTLPVATDGAVVIILGSGSATGIAPAGAAASQSGALPRGVAPVISYDAPGTAAPRGYEVDRRRAYDLTVTPSDTGAADMTLMGGGLQDRVRAKGRGAGHLATPVGGNGVDYRAMGAAALDLELQASLKDGTVRTGEATLAGAGAHAGIAFDAGRHALTLTNRGPAARVRLRFAAAGRGALPGTFEADVPLGTNERLEAAPAWADLTGQRRLTVLIRTRAGAVRRVVLGNRTARRALVRGLALSASRRGAAVRATVGVRALSGVRGGSVVFALVAVRSGRAVAHATAVISRARLRPGLLRRTLNLHLKQGGPVTIRASAVGVDRSGGTASRLSASRALR